METVTRTTRWSGAGRTSTGNPCHGRVADADRARDEAARRGERSDQQASGEKQEGRTRRAADGLDVAERQRGGMRPEVGHQPRAHRSTRSTLEGTRGKPGGGATRLIRLASTGRYGIDVVDPGSGSGREAIVSRASGFSLRGAAATFHARGRHAARAESIDRPNRSSHGLAHHREHPHNRRKGDQQEPKTMAREIHFRRNPDEKGVRH